MTVADIIVLLPPFTDVRVYSLNVHNYATRPVELKGNESKTAVRIAPDNRASNTIKIYV